MYKVLSTISDGNTGNCFDLFNIVIVTIVVIMCHFYKLVVLIQGIFHPPGDIGNVWRCFLVVTAWGCTTGI